MALAGDAVAAIDVGTNSFHLIVAQPTGPNRFEVLEREKEVIRLGSGSGDMKHLDPEAIERGVAALGRFARIAESFGAEVHAVATSAVREAENRQELLEAAESRSGVRIDVISGVEEARLIHLGVLQAVPLFDRQRLVIDIGGGSTEFVVGRAGDMVDARSLKLGGIRVSERFFAKEPVKKRVIDEARTFIRNHLPPVVRMVAEHGGFEVAAGSSGTIVNVAEMALARRGSDPVHQISNTRFSAAELDEVVRDLASRPRASDRLAVPGLDPRRADIILGGILVLEQAFQALEITELVVSDYALREGVLLDTLARRGMGTVGHLRDLRYKSVAHLAQLTPGELDHVHRVAKLASGLFEATRHLHLLGNECAEWLEAASLLCNVGLLIAHDRHHLHSHYVIRHSDVLTGFTDHEIEMIALVARYHRKSAPKRSHAEYARLHSSDQRIVKVLAGVLRVAVALDRTRAGVVSGVRVQGGRAGTPLQILVDTVQGADAELELYTTRSRCDLLAASLEVKIEITPASR
ncbi:MAG: Ppx/GppA phosphatase family protein [Acidimicrobiales bacterium]